MCGKKAKSKRRSKATQLKQRHLKAKKNKKKAKTTTKKVRQGRAKENIVNQPVQANKGVDVRDGEGPVVAEEASQRALQRISSQDRPQRGLHVGPRAQVRVEQGHRAARDGDGG